MTARTSPPFRAAQWNFAVLRLQTLLRRPWSTTAGGPFVSAPGGTRPAAFGDVFTSEQAVIVLLRWHVNKPSDVVGADGATGPIRRGFEQVFGTDAIDLAAQAEPVASQNQISLVN